MLEKFRSTATQIGQIIVGKTLQIRQSLTCLLAGGHLLIEDAPGVGKTTMAHAIAISMGLPFRRIQFTSDLLPSDVIGVSVYERNGGQFVFHPGPIFTEVLLADEINRASPKTQSALLEAMEEKPGVGRRLVAPVAAAVLRDRDAESAASGRYVSAARIAARSLSDVHQPGLSGPRRRTFATGGRSAARHAEVARCNRTTRRSAGGAGRSQESLCLGCIARLHPGVDCAHARLRQVRRRASARAAAWRCSPPPARGRGSTAANTSFRKTCRTSCRAWPATGCTRPAAKAAARCTARSWCRS